MSDPIHDFGKVGVIATVLGLGNDDPGCRETPYSLELIYEFRRYDSGSIIDARLRNVYTTADYFLKRLREDGSFQVEFGRELIVVNVRIGEDPENVVAIPCRLQVERFEDLQRQIDELRREHAVYDAKIADLERQLTEANEKLEPIPELREKIDDVECAALRRLGSFVEEIVLLVPSNGARVTAKFVNGPPGCTPDDVCRTTIPRNDFLIQGRPPGWIEVIFDTPVVDDIHALLHFWHDGTRYYTYSAKVLVRGGDSPHVVFRNRKGLGWDKFVIPAMPAGVEKVLLEGRSSKGVDRFQLTGLKMWTLANRG